MQPAEPRVEQRSDKMTLVDLRDSGRIEEDADVVFGCCVRSLMTRSMTRMICRSAT